MAKGQILLVEDDPGIREALGTALELAGYQVISAENGRDGIDCLQTHPSPCVILLDLMMPVMNGWQFAEALAQKPDLANIPIVVITAWADKRLDKAQAVIEKPINLDTLLQTVERFCP